MINLGISSFLLPRQTICQAGALAYIAKIPANKIAIIASNRSVNNYESLSKIIQNKKRFDAQVFVPKWRDEPDLATITENLKEIMDFQPDWIIAIGGGSVIDGAKILWALYENPTFDLERLVIPFSLPALRKKAKFIAVPTTAGSGSEASSAAIITSADKKIKIPVITHDFLPDIAILDSELLSNIPHKILLPSMLDALAHSLEGYVSKVQNKLASNLAILAIGNLISSLKLFADGDAAGEELALLGSYYSGIIQNLNVVGPAHALAHNMPTIPHAIATGFLLPNVVITHSQKSSELHSKYNRLALRIGFNNIDDLLAEIYDKLLPQLKITPKISSFVDGIIDFDATADAALRDNLVRFFPLKMERDDLIKILKAS